MEWLRSAWCNYVGWGCGDSNSRWMSADGEELRSGNEVWVNSRSEIGADAALDHLIITTERCEDPSQINVRQFNSSYGTESVCIDPSYAYVDSARSLAALLDGSLRALPQQLSIHATD
ncbi:MAG: hypothetical protein ABH859_07820 [Pseudomonadota bacterium]